MARIFSSATPGAPPLVSPPESLTLFPSLVSDLPPGARSEDPEITDLQPVRCKLDPSSMWMIAIEGRDTQSARMTCVPLSAPRSTLD